MSHFSKICYSFALIGLLSFSLFAQSRMEYRVSATVRFSPLKKVKLYLTPELRFRSTGLDKILLEAEAKYSPLKYLDVGGSYKLMIDKLHILPFELINRFDVYLGGEMDLGRFAPALRLMYVNYDEDEGISHFLRYKAKLDYDIPKSKIDPFVATELYHQLTDGTFYKMRFSIGADWRFAKKQSIGLAFKLDEYLDDARMKHIIDLGYTFKF